jgi:hypothetical protein
MVKRQRWKQTSSPQQQMRNSTGQRINGPSKNIFEKNQVKKCLPKAQLLQKVSPSICRRQTGLPWLWPFPFKNYYRLVDGVAAVIYLLSQIPAVLFR